MKKFLIPLLMSSLRITAMLAVIIWACLGPLENWNLYYPQSAEYAKNPMDALAFYPLPRPLKEVTFTSTDGVKLNGWFVPPASKDKPTVLYAHGNGGNMGDWVPVIQMFTKRGYGFFAFDYRGYGKSQGSPSEQGLYKDITAASRYLHDTQHIGPSQQIALGGSLGSAVVINAATQIPFRAVIAYACMSSAPAVAEHLRDTGTMSWLKYLPLQAVMQQTFNSLSKIEKINSPLILLHGERDHMMPVSMPKALYTKATSPQKTLILIPNAGHGDVIYGGETQLFAHLEPMLAQSTGG